MLLVSVLYIVLLMPEASFYCFTWSWSSKFFLMLLSVTETNDEVNMIIQSPHLV